MFSVAYHTHTSLTRLLVVCLHTSYSLREPLSQQETDPPSCHHLRLYPLLLLEVVFVVVTRLSIPAPVKKGCSKYPTLRSCFRRGIGGTRHRIITTNKKKKRTRRRDRRRPGGIGRWWHASTRTFPSLSSPPRQQQQQQSAVMLYYGVPVMWSMRRTVPFVRHPSDMS